MYAAPLFNRKLMIFKHTQDKGVFISGILHRFQVIISKLVSHNFQFHFKYTIVEQLPDNYASAFV